MADFSDKVKQYGSVSAALAASGYNKGSDGTWRKDSSSGGSSGGSSGSGSGADGPTTKTPSSAASAAAKVAVGDPSKATYGGTTTWAAPSVQKNASSGTASATSTNSSTRSLNAQGYDPNVDYSLAIRNETDPAKIAQLQSERQNKIDAMYGGVDPYTNPTVNQNTGKATTPANTASKLYGSSWTPQTATAESNQSYRQQQEAASSAFSSYLAQQVASGAMTQRDADLAWAKAGGVVNYADGTPAWHLSAQGYNTSADLSDAALDRIAQQGDWGGVDEILRQRQLRAQAQGLNYDAIPDWFAMNQKYGGPSAGLTLEQMYAGAQKAYGGGKTSVENVQSPVTGGNVNLNAGVNPGSGTAGGYGGSMQNYLDQWYQSAQQQQQNTVDFGTNQAILELLRAQQDAEAQYQEQRNQIAIDEAKAKDNQALYAEQRGDKGGIGAAQYDAIMNTAAQNRLQVNSAQTKLATDTSRQIADLRAQGEYEKADALLTLSQQYLSQLMSLEQWAAEYNLSVAQFNASLQQWQAEFDLKVADLLGSYNGQQTLSAKEFALNQQQYQDSLKADQEKKLASAGEILLAAGIMPSASQLAAMGMTETDAQSYITAQKVAAATAKGKSGGGSTGSGDGSSQDYDGLMTAARSAPDAKSFIANNYKKYGFTSSTGLYDYYNNTWLPDNQTADTLDPDKVNNPHGSKMVQIKKGNSYTYMTWASAADWIDKGKIKIRNDGDDTYTLVFVGE